MEKIQATVGILTFNSEKTLERALESVKDFSDILICDGGSTDRTLEIAQRYRARIIPQITDATGPKLITDFAAVRNRCLEAAGTDWFLYIDSDERAEPELVQEIARVVEHNPQGLHVYKISPRIIYQGRRIEHASSYPGYQTRFFRISPDICFQKAVHERIVFPTGTNVHTLDGHWNYFLSGPEEITEDIETRDIPILLQRYEGAPRTMRFWGSLNALTSFVSIFFRSFRNHIFFPSSSMPWRVEVAKMSVQYRFFCAILLRHKKKI